MLRIFRYGAFSLSFAQIARFSHSLERCRFCLGLFHRLRGQARSHRFQWCSHIPRTTVITVGAGLPANAVVRAAKISSLIPQRATPLTLWEPGLPAIAVGQSVRMLKVPAPSRASLNWSSNLGHRLRCLCRFLLHGYWRQVVVIAMESGAVVALVRQRDGMGAEFHANPTAPDVVVELAE